MIIPDATEIEAVVLAAPLVSGHQRSVYGVPDISDTVLKIPHYRQQDGMHRVFKRSLRRMFPAGRFRVLTKEAEFQMALTLRYPSEAVLLPLPQFRGFVATDEGLGALWQMAAARAGGLGRNLRQIAEDGDLDSVRGPLNTCAARLFRFGIVAPDLHAGNLVLDETAALARFLLVDGFGDRNVIPVRSMSRRLNEASLNKQLAHVAAEVGLFWHESERKFRSIRGT